MTFEPIFLLCNVEVSGGPFMVVAEIQDIVEHYPTCTHTPSNEDRIQDTKGNIACHDNVSLK